MSSGRATRSVNRRSVIKTAAWAAPVIAVATAAPSASASEPAPTFTASTSFSCSNGLIVVESTILGLTGAGVIVGEFIVTMGATYTIITLDTKEEAQELADRINSDVKAGGYSLSGGGYNDVFTSDAWVSETDSGQYEVNDAEMIASISTAVPLSSPLAVTMTIPQKIEGYELRAEFQGWAGASGGISGEVGSVDLWEAGDLPTC